MITNRLFERVRETLSGPGLLWVALFFLVKFLLKVLLVWLFLNFIQ